MNILPTSPDVTATPDQIEQYFRDMERWNFDVAYSAFYAFPLAELKGPYKEPYTRFVKTAHDKGYPACIQIQSTVGFLDDVGIENAQYYTDNTTYIYGHFKKYGRKNFFGSFAAPGWFDYIRNITEILRSYGFDWVVFEEPMFRCDIPGTKDKLFERFKAKYPDLEYPTHQEESLSYQRLQQLKGEILLDFYRRLTSFAREIGYEKRSVMPWFFVPTFENTPMETWNTCCHLGKMTFLPDLDFIVVRMQPDNVFEQATIASAGEAIPQISYLENLAQNLGKPIISVNNPTNEHIPHSADTPDNLLPFDFFARFTLAAAAAVPSGMSRHWYKKDYKNDQQHMALMKEVNQCLPLLGSPKSSLAMVFSYTGMNRTVPRPWTESWKSFWFLADRLLYRLKQPTLSFFAGTLAESLRLHPETRLLIFNEYFPISPEEIEIVEQWLDRDPQRRLLYIGARNGYRHSLDALYHDFHHKPPEMTRLFGCDPDQAIRTVTPGETVSLKFAGSDPRMAFLGEKPSIRCRSFGIPVPHGEKDLQILYTAGPDENPVALLRKTENGGSALFLGLATDGLDNDLPIGEIVDFLLTDKTSDFLVKDASRGILWNRTANGFLFIANCDDRPGSYRIDRPGLRLWNVRISTISEIPERFSINPLDFHLLRILEKSHKLLDLEGLIFLHRIEETFEKIRVSGYFRKHILVRLLEKPDTVLVNGKEHPFEWNDKGEFQVIDVDTSERGEKEITILFSNSPGPGSPGKESQ